MATQRTHYVDTDVSGGAGDGSSWENAFHDLAAWEAHANGDLVSLNVWEDCQVRGSTAADTTQLDIDGWTTDATRDIRITVEAADRHAGIWSDTKFRFTPSNVNAILIREDFVSFDGFQFTITDPSAARYIFQFVARNAGSILNFSNSIVKGWASASLPIFWYTTSGTNTTLNFWNIISYGWGNSANAYLDYTETGTLNIYNSTFLWGGTTVTAGIRREAGTVVCKNVYSGGCYVGRAFFGTISQTTCAASDTSAADAALDSIAINTTNFTNVTGGSEDLRLPGTGSALYHVGTDTSGDSAPLNFTTDINGDTYYSTRSIGADEYVAGGATAIVLMLGDKMDGNANTMTV